MPAKDKYHDVVVNALRKHGWQILTEQYTIPVGKRRIWIDIRAANEDVSQIILVEVKSFYNVASQIEALSTAIGKYLLYRAIMIVKNIEEDLFLAIPKSAYEGIFSEEVGQALLKQVDVKFIVYDIEKEEISQWIR